MAFRYFTSLALLLWALISAPALAQQKQVWKASDVHPLGYPTVEAIVRMGKKLEAQTGGNYSIQMFPSMQLYAEVQTGVVDGAENTPPTLHAQNHYHVSKGYSLSGQLLIPEIFVFSKRNWETLRKEDQELVKKLSREAQLEQRQRWEAYVGE